MGSHNLGMAVSLRYLAKQWIWESKVKQPAIYADLVVGLDTFGDQVRAESSR